MHTEPKILFLDSSLYPIFWNGELVVVWAKRQELSPFATTFVMHVGAQWLKPVGQVTNLLKRHSMSAQVPWPTLSRSLKTVHFDVFVLLLFLYTKHCLATVILCAVLLKPPTLQHNSPIKSWLEKELWHTHCLPRLCKMSQYCWGK